MKITKRLFDEVLVLEPPVRADRRGTMADFSPEMIRTVLPDKEWILQRIYTMPERHTFFGIHFQKDPYPQAKLISVLQGKGLDYVVDLRPGAETFAQWQSVELDSAQPVLVYIPSGFGHAFLSLGTAPPDFWVTYNWAGVCLTSKALYTRERASNLSWMIRNENPNSKH